MQSTVLIVDDTVENIDILSNLLRSEYKVKAVRSGEQALKVAAMDPKPDMILLDILMPEMDGYEVIEQLKKDDATKQIPVIFISAKNEVEDEQLGFALGASDYITKPFSPPIVLARVATHLTLYKHQQEMAKQNEELKKALRVWQNQLSRAAAPAKTKEEVEEAAVIKSDINFDEYFLDDHRIDLSELIEEIDSVINMIILKDRFDHENIKRAGQLLLRYAYILMLYPAFKRLGMGMYDFAQKLSEEDLNPTKENMDYAFGCLESLIYTLDHWHHHIFANDLKNPNAFDNSMLADMETIKKALENDYGDDEIEFF